MVIYGVRRGLVCSTAAAAGGALLWVAADRDPSATGGYWSVTGIVGAAGLALALIPLYARADDRRLPRLRLEALLTGVLPALVAGGWIIVAAQPHGNWFRSHVLGWSSDTGIRGAVDDLRPYAVVLAVGLGLLFGLAFDRSVRPTESADTTDTIQQEDTELPLPVEHQRVLSHNRDLAATTVITPAPEGDTVVVAAPTVPGKSTT